MSPDPAMPSAKLTKLGWMLRGAIGKENTGSKESAIFSNQADYMNYDREMMFKNITESFDFGKFWSGENVGISPNERDFTNSTVKELQADDHQRKTARYDPKGKCWYVDIPRKGDSVHGKTLSDNYPRAVAMWRKIVERIKPKDVELVNNACNEFHELGIC